MSLNHLLSLFFTAAAIALGVSVFIAPRLEPRPQETAAALSTEPKTRPTEATWNNGLAVRATFRKSDDGHFWAKAEVDGLLLDFLIDTGASTVALTAKDAQRLGVLPDAAAFTHPVSTAGGTTKGAYVILDTLRIGDVRLDEVRAIVLRDGLEQNLLGMSVLGDLYSIELRGDRMIIRN